MNGNQIPIAVELALAAANKRIVIYAGAGLSLAEPTGLPDGPEVAQRCYNRLLTSLGPAALAGADKSDLTSVADTIASNTSQPDLARFAALKAARFKNAQPNYGHEILALLLLEGHVVVFTTNWDNCIERSTRAEQIPTIVTDIDHQQIESPALFKVHGCATQPLSALVTSEELRSPPTWVRDEVNARLTRTHTTFVGVGEVAKPIRIRIQEAETAIGSFGRIVVVAPEIEDSWASSNWAQILQNPANSHPVSETADRFLDNLAAACIRRILDDIAEALADDVGSSEMFAKTRSSFESQTALKALRWLRACGVPRESGVSVMHQQAFAKAMIALGMLAATDDLWFDADGRVETVDGDVSVLVAVGSVSASEMRRQARVRSIAQVSDGKNSGIPRFLLAGALGRVDADDLFPIDVTGNFDRNDIFDGPMAITPVLSYAEDLLA